MPGPTTPAIIETQRPGTVVRRRRLRTAAVAGLLLTVLAAGPACSDDEPDSPTAGDTLPDPSTSEPAPTTADPTTTTTAPPTPEEEVEAAYLDIIETYYQRLVDPDPVDRSIAENHTGASLEAVRAQTADTVKNNQSARFPSGSPPVPEILEVTVEGPTKAEIRNCIIDDVQVVERESGNVVDDEVVSSLVESTLVSEDSRWKLSAQTRVARWSDSKGCNR